MLLVFFVQGFCTLVSVPIARIMEAFPAKIGNGTSLTYHIAMACSGMLPLIGLCCGRRKGGYLPGCITPSRAGPWLSGPFAQETEANYLEEIETEKGQ